MLRLFVLFMGLVVLLGAGVAVAAWPRPAGTPTGFSSNQQLMQAYTKVHQGTPASQLAGLGFDPARAHRLSGLGLMEHFMPGNSFAFDTLDPQIQTCFDGRSDCIAYVYGVAQSPAQAVLLVAGGRVAWKSVTGVRVSALNRRARTVVD